MKKFALRTGALLLAVMCSAQGGDKMASAQMSAAPANAVADVKAAYASIKSNVTKMAEKMPEENYSFKASPDIRSFGELMAHIATAQVLYCSMAAGEMKRPADVKGSKADIVVAIKGSFDACDAVFDKLTDASAMEGVTARAAKRMRLSVLWGMIVHSNEEYGYGSIYLRLKGIVPPSSDTAGK
jgi:hypothetical protein